MKEHPILFSGAMVRALLDGSKTQTRRVVKPQPISVIAQPGEGKVPAWAIVNQAPATGVCVNVCGNEDWLRCPYGKPGDRLWVRETFLDTLGTGVEHQDDSGTRHRYAFAADCAPGSYGDQARKDYGLKWKPSIHMPRVACRILLEIVSVRVERLQNISEADAKAEGITPHEVRHFAIFGASAAERAAIYRDAAVRPYRGLWQQINGVGSWDANPWVWVIEFKRVRL